MNSPVYDAVKEIVSPVYMVGGSVRDLMLGRTPKDYDFATPLSPDEIEARVRAAERRPYLVGKRFGTIGFKVEVEGVWQMVEVTTFRAETYTAGCRKPDVRFVREITADLARRDFTINAMALRDGRLIDPFGGQSDLEGGVLRSVGQPSHRFKEDPLRLLRLVRFAAQLDFSVEEATENHALQRAHTILTVSRERWNAEMDKLLVAESVTVGLYLMAWTRLLSFVLPELWIQVEYDQNTPYHDFSLWEHTLRVVDATPADVTLRWAALLHDVGKPFVRTEREDRSNYIKHDMVGAELVLGIAHRLKWSNDRRDAVAALVRDHLQDDSPLKEADSGSQKRKVDA